MLWCKKLGATACLHHEISRFFDPSDKSARIFWKQVSNLGFLQTQMVSYNQFAQFFCADDFVDSPGREWNRWKIRIVEGLQPANLVDRLY